MKTQRILLIAKPRLLVVLVLAVLAWVGSARAGQALDEQLMQAAASGHLEVVQELLTKGADVAAKDEFGETALGHAAASGHLEVARLLKAHGAEVTLFIETNLGDEGEVQRLIGAGADVNAREKTYGITALIHAIESGQTEIARLLIDKGADTNAKDGDGATALMVAAGKGNLEMVKLLIDKGSDINVKDKDGRTTLMCAASNGSPEMVKLLIDKGADINAKDKGGGTALMSAASNGNLETVRLLIAKGADINAKDNDGGTALMAAAGNRSLEVLKVLIDAGGDINATPAGGRTALWNGVWSGNLEAAKLLMDRHADIDARDQQGWTILMAAAYRGRPELVRLLIDKGAKLDAQDRRGWTALMQAAMFGHLQVVRLLVNAGADVNIVTKYGRTALELAEVFNHTDEIQYLRAQQLHRGDLGHLRDHISEYPATPEEVVKAFVGTVLEEPSLTVEEMSIFPACETAIVMGQSEYFAREGDVKAHEQNTGIPLPPGGFSGIDKFHVITGFKIKAVETDKDKAVVRVSLRRAGWVWRIPFLITECRNSEDRQRRPSTKPSDLLEAEIKIAGERKGQMWDEEGCRLLHITNDSQEVVYTLVKPEKYWRITGSHEQRLSVPSAIRVLECEIKTYPGVSKTPPSQDQELTITRDIKVLQEYIIKSRLETNHE